MEFELYPGLLTALICLAITILIIFVYGNPWQRWKQMNVPGPTPAWFMGNFTQLYSHKKGLMSCMKQWQQEFGFIYGIYYLREPVLVVTDLDLIKQVFIKDFNSFRDRWFIGGKGAFQEIINKGLFFAGGDTWHRERKLMTPIFTSGKLRALTDHINVCGKNLVESLEEHADQCKLVSAKDVFGAFTVDVIFRSMLSLDANSQKDIDGPWFQHAKSLITIRKQLQIVFLFRGLLPFTTPLFGWLDLWFFKNSDINFFKNQIMGMINERKINNKLSHADMLQFLINSEADESDIKNGELKKLTTEEIIAQCIVFVIAGYETSSTTLQFLGYELAKRPDVQEKMYQEILDIVGKTEDPSYNQCQQLRYVEAVIYETLRFYPPLTLLSRQSTAPIDLAGYHLNANQAIFIPVSVVMRDPTHFPDPDTFDPMRFFGDENQSKNLAMFLPFGLGGRHCIGMRLAMLQIKMVLVHIIRNLKFVSATPEKLVIQDFANLPKPKESIMLTVASRASR